MLYEKNCNKIKNTQTTHLKKGLTKKCIKLLKHYNNVSKLTKLNTTTNKKYRPNQ